MSRLVDDLTEEIPGWPIAVMRIYSGFIFFGAAAIDLSARPNTGVVTLSLEFIVAMALTLGAATRATALLGLGIVLARMWPVPGLAILVSPGPRTAFAMLLLTLALGGGTVFGLDGLLGRPRTGTEHVRMPRWPLVLLRVYLGAGFLRAALNKIGDNWTPWPGWMAGVIQERLPQSAPVYREFLSSVVLPHVALFAPTVACAEVAVGCCLLLGLAARGAGLVGALLALNYLLMNGVRALVPGIDPVFMFGSNDPVFLMGCLTVAAAAGGRALGLDHLLHQRFPRFLLS